MKKHRQGRRARKTVDQGARPLADAWDLAPRGVPGVYAVLNWINGRIYVGSAYDMRSRLHQHRSLIKALRPDNMLLRRDVLHFGPECFSIFPLETVPTDLPKLAYRLGSLEWEWTLRLNAHTQSGGYNCQLVSHWTKATKFRDHERKRIRWRS